MEKEPFELNGKTIRDSHYQKISEAQVDLILEFTDNTTAVVKVDTQEDCESGDEFPTRHVVIQNI